MTSARLLLTASLLASLVAGASVACSSTTDVTPGTGDGGTADSAAGDSAPGDSGSDGLYPSDTTKVTVTSKGGFTAQAPDGSTCQQVDNTWTYTPATHALAWKLCEAAPDAGADAPTAFRTSEKTLTAAEYAPLEAAFRGLERATDPACGADAPNQDITFTTPAGDVTYLDDFYFCSKDDTKTYVTNLDSVISPLTQLSK